MSELKLIITMFQALGRLAFRSSFAAKMSEIIKRETAQIHRAARVRDNIENSCYSAEVETKLRRRVTVESTMDELEKEMRQEIARALKSSEWKVLALIKIA